jgi:hypothetical protein
MSIAPAGRTRMRRATIVAFILFFVVAAMLVPDMVYEGWRQPTPF